jgi:ParB family chromosome partitioning protein
MGHARALLSLEGVKQVELARKIAKDGLTVRAAERLVKDAQEAPKPLNVKVIDHDTRRLQRKRHREVSDCLFQFRRIGWHY